jgi:hypothetical protein
MMGGKSDMDFIRIQKGPSKLGGIERNVEISADGMEGLRWFLQDSYAINTLGKDQECRDEFHSDSIRWSGIGFFIKSVGKNLVEVGVLYPTDDCDEDGNEEKYRIVVPKDALWKFIPIYQAADKEEWTSMKIGFDGKQFKLWLNGEEYNPDPAELNSLDVFYKSDE